MNMWRIASALTLTLALTGCANTPVTSDSADGTTQRPTSLTYISTSSSGDVRFVNYLNGSKQHFGQRVDVASPFQMTTPVYPEPGNYSLQTVVYDTSMRASATCQILDQNGQVLSSSISAPGGETGTSVTTTAVCAITL